MKRNNPLFGAPAQRCGIAKQEQVEEDHKVQLEEDGDSKVVGGSMFVCLRQLPSLSQREDSRHYGESVDNEAGLGAGWPTGQVVGQPEAPPIAG